MRTIVVSGALASRPHNGGGAWVRLSWVRGLRRLGFRVHFVEQAAPAISAEAESFFRSVMTDDATLLRGEEDAKLKELQSIAESCELLVNLGGHLSYAALLRRFRRKVYVDLDPGYTQFWHAADGTPFR